MDLFERILQQSRKNSTFGRKLRRLLQGASLWSVPAGPLHRLLLAERSVRRRLVDELARALYYQPLFELQCDRAKRPFRMETCPDSKLPVVTGCRLRVERGVRLSGRTTFSGARNAPRPPVIALGEGTYVGHRVTFRAGLDLTLGRNCFVASYVTFSGDPGHPLDPVARRTEAAPLEDLAEIVVEDDVWIGEGALILGPVRIGAGAVIGARSVVTRDVPPGVVATGVPARVVRRIVPRTEPVGASGGDGASGESGIG